nr:unnamed protein product [Callosobruchus chinensis]
MESRNQTTSSAAVTSASVPTPSTSPSPATDTDGSAGPWQRVQGRRTRKRSSLVIGAGSDNNVKGVAKRVSLHVSRIHPQTTLDEMETMVRCNFPEASVEQLKSKYPDEYSSFKVSIYQSVFGPRNRNEENYLINLLHPCLYYMKEQLPVHFSKEMWEKTREDVTRKLKSNAIPTIFSFSQPKK